MASNRSRFTSITPWWVITSMNLRSINIYDALVWQMNAIKHSYYSLVLPEKRHHGIHKVFLTKKNCPLLHISKTPFLWLWSILNLYYYISSTNVNSMFVSHHQNTQMTIWVTIHFFAKDVSQRVKEMLPWNAPRKKAHKCSKKLKLKTPLHTDVTLSSRSLDLSIIKYKLKMECFTNLIYPSSNNCCFHLIYVIIIKIENIPFYQINCDYILILDENNIYLFSN